MRPIEGPYTRPSWDPQLIRRVVLIRIASTLGLAAATASIPALGPNRFALSLLLAVPVPITTWFIHKISPPEEVVRRETLADVVWTLVAVQILPDTLAPAAVVSMALLALLAQEDRPSLALPAVIGSVGFATLGWIHDIDLWLPMVAGYTLMVPLHFFVAMMQAQRVAQFETNIRHRIEHDPLTGLLNRAGLAVAFSEARPEAVMIVDLDGFKDVNDTLGHDAGDQLLRLLAERMNDVVADDQVLARIGGDEFAIAVFEGDPDRVASDILHACRRRVTLDEIDVSVGASIGVAATGDESVEGPELLRRADLAMYEAKRGHGGVRRWTALTQTVSLERVSLSGEVERGFERGEFELFFQPMVEIENEQVVEVEGLLRWRHPTRGLLAPADFLQLIEGIGRRSSMDREVFDQAAAMASTINDRGIGVSVNVSAGSLLRSSLPRVIDETLRHHGVSARQITVEILEDQVVDEHSTARAVIGALGELGVGIAIDDFGTGYSSLSRLRRLPVTTLKIDRSFVMSMLDSRDDEAIVSAVAGLGKALELMVVAEGVEDMAVRTRILDQGYGIDRLQGFGIARPMPAPDLLTWLDSRDRVDQVR